MFHPLRIWPNWTTDFFKKLAEKVGKEKAEKTYAAFDDTYFSHRDFVAVFHPALSYKAEQLSEPGNNYREWFYVYYEQKHQEEMMGLMKQWRDLFASKGVPQGYAIYTNGFGHEGPVIVVHTWAKSREENLSMTRERFEILGEENEKLWNKTRNLAYKIDSKTGSFWPENSYISTQ